MAEGYYKVVCDILQALGYEYQTNAKGSHEKWRSRETGKLVLVPHNLKSRHTANAILKTAGSNRKV
ncbi:MAG TPA: type II toxin-antitoxin system HicA family toxin [Pararhizobium sp.]|uniref:type II toxin-antitoxin system HicA family toxin n=1 Tax=Pararhizobium sp. TaxID=1977563 RepID=UPI002BEB9A12|nr:type II toxin-antitoxin system HicA family toxin [Pararhizobium sp.]HTO33582.1 type II toxin-antitoxin system HicA family toxin [Pararhizobium sp.]